MRLITLKSFQNCPALILMLFKFDISHALVFQAKIAAEPY